MDSLKDKDLFILDMDGTFYLGNKLLKGSLEFAEKLKTLGKKLVFLTNNSSKTPDEYIKKLNNLGVSSELFDVYTSGEATAEFIKEKFKERRIFLLATDSVKKLFLEKNLIIDDTNPEILILTYDKTIDYEKIQKFSYFLRKNLPFVASHPDINCPTENGFIPDIGSFLALFETSTGRKPDYIVGKPNPYIVEMLLKKYDVPREKAVIMGDRIYTDIKCGLNSGVDSILVLSGETSIDMVPENHPYKVHEDIEEILSKCL
ncbi:MAG: hypothetical protein PWQ77_1689 [Kosmotogales bacterium]|nr:hypothetical protein [Kosmotogales bacterium]